MEELAQRMEKLLSDALKNGEIESETMQKMAETMQNMQELSRQDMPKVQQGLESTYKPGVTLASYQESKVRWLHHRLGEFIEEGEKKAGSR